MNKTANAMENGEYDFDGTVDKKVHCSPLETFPLISYTLALGKIKKLNFMYLTMVAFVIQGVPTP